MKVRVLLLGWLGEYTQLASSTLLPLITYAKFRKYQICIMKGRVFLLGWLAEHA